MLVISSHHHDHRKMRSAPQLLNDLESTHLRHLEIEKYDVRPQRGDFLERADAAVGLTHHGNTGLELNLLPQHTASYRFIVDDERAQRLGLHRNVYIRI